MRAGRARLLVLGLLALAVAGGVALWLARLPDDGRPPPLYGTVEVRQVDLGFLVEGRLAEVLVEEGSPVEAGAVLGRLEKGYFEEALALARARVAAQEQVLAELVAGPRQQEIEEAEAALSSAEAILVNARRNFERQEELVRTNAAAERVLDEARAARDTARAAIDEMRARLSLLRAGSREEKVAAARARLDAEKALAALAERRLGDAELVAPSDGVIISRVREPGAVLAPGATVLTMARTEPVWVRAFVPEPRLGDVRPGAPALVFTDARPGEPYEGTVGYVSPVAEFTPKTVQTEDLRTDLVFRFHVVIRDPDPLLRQGMPVTVRLR